MGSPAFFIDTFFALIALSYTTAPLWLTLGLGYVLYHVWIYYARARFLAKKEYVLLEIKLPQEIMKSPLAMELVLGGLHQTANESTWYDRKILGKVRVYFSLEIASFEGAIKFFIRTDKFLRKTVEAQIYSQYPTVEITEVPDYTNYVHYGEEGSDWSLWGARFTLIEENYFPIKTYVDYGLDKSVREETEKIDPLTPMLEYLGTMGPGEQAWYQILIRANRGKRDKTSYWDRDWEKAGHKAIDEIMEKYKYSKDDTAESSSSMLMTPSDKDKVESITKSFGKLAFDCGMRGIYLAKKDKFSPTNKPALLSVVKQYNAPGRNGLKPTDATEFDYPWQDYKDMRINRIKANLFDGFRRRSFFFPPHERKPFVLNIEELATIYHFPGGVAETPTFGRIGSKKAEPPINLPV